MGIYARLYDSHAERREVATLDVPVWLLGRSCLVITALAGQCLVFEPAG
jgi:hypothetical protein